MNRLHPMKCAAGLAVLGAVLALPGAPAAAQCGEPATDSPCAPYVLNGTLAVQEVVMDVSTATPDLAPACGLAVGHTVWFEIAPATDGLITFSTCHPETAYDTVVQAWIDTGDCEFPQLIESWCNDDTADCSCVTPCSTEPRGSVVTVAATAGTTYLFEVGSFNGNAAGCDLCLGVTVHLFAAPPANDDCCHAFPVGAGIVPFDTTGATTDGPELPAACDEGNGLSFVNDLWYVWTPLCDGLGDIALCSSGYDTRLAVYEGESCTGPLVACNDDACGTGGFMSAATFPVTANTAYLIRVGGFVGEGPGVMSVMCIPSLLCPGDLDGNGSVGFNDLNLLLAVWGPCPGCPEDLDGNGTVGFNDLNTLLSAWGPCP